MLSSGMIIPPFLFFLRTSLTRRKRVVVPAHKATLAESIPGLPKSLKIRAKYSLRPFLNPFIISKANYDPRDFNIMLFTFFGKCGKFLPNISSTYLVSMASLQQSQGGLNLLTFIPNHPA
jgi:hypothetical protein